MTPSDNECRVAFEKWVTTIWHPDDGAELLKKEFPRFAYAAWQAAWNARAGQDADAKRLEWVSRYLNRDPDYAMHVLKRCGNGDLSDIRSFIDDAMSK
jgi:hypothetical protein